MSGSIYIRGANTSAQWYQSKYSGSTFSRLEKFLIHTTETTGWPSYGGGASAPNATYHPRLRQTRQHFGINRSARALRDPSNTAVRENRDNVFQLEIICYSDYILAKKVGGLWVGDLTATHMRDIAAMVLQCHRDWGLPMQSSVTWREGRQGWYDNVRLSGSQYDAYRGILGHVHASGNTHWDPGGFRYSKLKAALSWQFANHPVYGGGTTIPDPTVPGGGFDPEEDMPYTDWPKADKDALAADLARAVHERSVQAGMETEPLGQAVGRTLAGVRRIETAQIDVDALAAAIVGKLPNAGSGSIDVATVKQGVIDALREGVGE
jgi:hypothetical protein